MNLSENLESKCYSFIHRDSLLIRLAYLFTALADTDWCLLLGQVESSETQRETPGQHRAHPELWVLTSTYCKWYLPQLPATALGTNRMGRTSLPWRTWPLAPPTFTPFSFFFSREKARRISALSPGWVLPPRSWVCSPSIYRSVWDFQGALQSGQGSLCCGNFMAYPKSGFSL